MRNSQTSATSTIVLVQDVGTIFARIHQRLRGNVTFKNQTADCGHIREVKTVQLEEAVLEVIAL